MKIECPQCSAVYSIDDSLLVGKAIRAQCPACGHIQVVREETPAQQPAKPPPLPGKDEQPDEVPGIEHNPLQVFEQDTSTPGDALEDPFSGPGSSLEIEQGPAAEPSSAPPPLPELPQIEPTGQSAQPAPEAGAAGVTGTVPAAAGESRCERCGAVMRPGEEKEGLCARCQRNMPTASLGSGEREWRVKKPDGVVLGPLNLAEVKQKFSEGEIAAADKVARGEGDFKLISSFPEFAEFFRRPGEAMELSFKHPPESHKGRNAIIAMVVLALLGAGGWYYMTHIRPGAGSSDEDVMDKILASFSAEFQSPEGSSKEAVESGRKLMLLDDRLSHIRADKLFKKAIVLEPTSVDACAGWVQNRALLDRYDPDVDLRKTALDLIDYSLERNPDDPLLLRAKAYLYWSIDRVEEARRLASKALEKLGEDPQTELILGATYLDSSTQMAIELIRKAWEKESGLQIAARLLGEANIRLGKFRKALRYFKKRLEQDPGQYNVLQATAKVYLEVGQFKKARETLEMMLAAEPSQVDALVAVSRLNTQVLDRSQRALALIEKSLARSENMPASARARVLVEQSIALRILGRKEEAGQAIEKALQDDSILVPALFARAVLEHEKGEAGLAVAHYKELLVQLPHSARLRARLAEARTLVPDFQRAEQDLKSAVEIGGSDLDIYLMMAVFHVFLDNPTQTYGWLKKATGVDPFHHESHLTLDPLYAKPSFLRLSAKRALEAVEKYEEDPLIMSLCGAVLLRHGSHDRARSMLLGAIERDEECHAANLYLGVLYLEQGKTTLCLPYLERAHESNSLHRVTALLYARALLASGKTRQAREILEGVLESAPGDLGAKLVLAQAHLKSRKRSKAAELLLRVYQGDRDNLMAKRLLFKLGR